MYFIILNLCYIRFLLKHAGEPLFVLVKKPHLQKAAIIMYCDSKHFSMLTARQKRKSVGPLWYPFEVEAPSFLPLPLPPPIFSLDGSLLTTVRY